MCGLAGFWDINGVDGAAELLQSMTCSIQHRGPDSSGQWFDDRQSVALGHRRLAIVDLSEGGAQPMHSATTRYTVVFNGEIYNFRALREELRGKGIEFRSDSDTEVLLAAVELWGVHDAIARCNGMFAFALWDAKQRVLHLGRDRAGEKPLYFAAGSDFIAFGSELKSLYPFRKISFEGDHTSLYRFLKLGYVPHGRTMFRNVAKVLPGEIITVSESAGRLKLDRVRYWNVRDIAERTASDRAGSMTLGEASQTVEALLSSVVQDEMLADVPLGAFLSGGIDSSLIVALMQSHSSRPVRTFTIAFDQATHDESHHAAAIAAHLGTDHTEIPLSSDGALDLIPGLMDVFDEPFADSSQLPTMLVCAAARKHVTVALSGDGGDEFFGGYPHYRMRDRIIDLVGVVPNSLRSSAGWALSAVPRTFVERAIERMSRDSRGNWAPEMRIRLINALQTSHHAMPHLDHMSKWVEPALLLQKRDKAAHANGSFDEILLDSAVTDVTMQRMVLDASLYLPDDILVKVDRSAMRSSLETRAPLLDHRVIEFALRMPDAVRFADNGKGVLKAILNRHVPRAMWDRPKRGFAVPLGEWLRGPLREWAASLLGTARSSHSPIHSQLVDAVWIEHLNGTRDHAFRLWPILILLQWLERHPSAFANSS